MADAGNSDRIVVKEVSKDSPAEKAGIKVEDEIVRINGLSTANGKFSALARTLAEGDTVTLSIKRDGKVRQYTVVAAKRPDNLAYFNREIIIAPDSVRTLMRRYLDTARVHLDSLRLPNIYIGRGDSAIWHFRGHGTRFPSLEERQLDVADLPRAPGEGLLSAGADVGIRAGTRSRPDLPQHGARCSCDRRR